MIPVIKAMKDYGFKKEPNRFPSIQAAKIAMTLVKNRNLYLGDDHFYWLICKTDEEKIPCHWMKL